MTQTNVTTALTASFNLANVLREKTDYERVSCTRIRCGIATFACNDGGYETDFFAKHFMKNREETTGLHYNLLSNRRHALNIAMNLYESFSGMNGHKIELNKKEVTELMKNITKASESNNKDFILNWLRSNDKEVSKKEIQ